MTDSPAAPAPRKVTLYRNGSVYTAADPFATAMLVDGDTVAWVGSEQAATSIADSSMEVIDLHGALLAPGFVDSHVHLTETGIALDSLQLGGVRSARELLDAVAGFCASASGAGGTVLGHGWDETSGRTPPCPAATNWNAPPAGGRSTSPGWMRTRRSCPPRWRRPPASTGLDGFGAGGQVKRAAHTAARLAARRLPAAALRGYQQQALAEAAANGYVALAEMAAPHIGSIEDLRLAAGLEHRRPDAPFPEILPYWGELADSAEHARSILDGLGVPVLGLAGDLNIDGSIGSRTAALRADYSDAPGERGSLYLSVAEAAAHLAACSLLGIQAGFHVIGDAGLDAALDALDLAAAEVGEQRVRAAGHRFEHVEIADADAIGRLAKYSVTVSAQPGFDAAWGGAGRSLPAAPRDPAQRHEPVRLLLRRRRADLLRQRQPGDAAAALGQRAGLPASTTTRPNGSRPAPRSSATPGPAGGQPGTATRWPASWCPGARPALPSGRSRN